MNKITLEELDKWIDGLEPKPQTTKYTIPDYPFFGLIVRPNGVKSIYIKNDNKKMCDVGFLFKDDCFSLFFFDFTLSRYSKLEDLFKKARSKYIKDKIKTYKNFVNISVKGGGFMLFLFIACAIIDNVENISTFFFISYLVLIFIASFLLTGILDEKASSLIASKHVEEAQSLSLKDNAEYRNAIKDELRQANKRDRFLKYPELFKVVFLEAKELLPEEFIKEVQSLTLASEIFFSLDGNIRELILSKTELMIDQIVERQIDEFISLKVRLEEKKEKIEQNMEKFGFIAKAE